MLKRMKYLKYLLLDREDNPELVSVLTVLMAIAFLTYSSYSYLYEGQQFSPLAWGSGAAAIIAALGGAKKWSNQGDYDAR